jgi:hypothetical protein
VELSCSWATSAATNAATTAKIAMVQRVVRLKVSCPGY